jgi:hypothetical protein
MSLQGFAYGEHRDGPHQRSLGFRLLAPVKPYAWTAEVEALARRLHASPYPEHWPPTDLFCSVLLETGERLIAVARYGLRDHTPSGRLGAFELFGVIGPPIVSPADAIRIYHGLRKHRSSFDDLLMMDREFESHEWPATVEAVDPVDPVPVLPVNAWLDGALLFAAATPGEPDSRLGLLKNAGENWQWLPLVGGDFPLRDFAKRGPLVAWTPHLAGVALKIDHPNPVPPAPVSPRRLAWWPLLVLLLIALTGANLWFTYVNARKKSPTVPPVVAREPQPPPDDSPERLALAMHRYWQKNGTLRDVSAAQLMANYERLAAQDPDFRTTNPEAKLAIGALSHLARRSPTQIEEAARQALDGKGFDPEVVQLICRRIYQRMNESKD